MRKRMLPLLTLCLILGLFVGCNSSSPSTDDSAPLLERFSALESYRFIAVGEVIYQGELDDTTLLPPFRYNMEGAFCSRTNQLDALILYDDPNWSSSYALSLLQTGNVAYVTFAPLFRHILNTEYNGDYDLADAFGGDPFLYHPTANLTDLLPNLPALIGGLSALEEEELEGLLSIDADGRYILNFPGNRLSRSLLAELTSPFSLYLDIHPLADSQADNLEETEYPKPDFFSPLLHGDMGGYTLHLILAHDDTYTAALTLTAPGLMTIRVDLIYQSAALPALAPPDSALELADMWELLASYRAAHARAAFLRESGLEIVFDLPELHMLDHRLDTDLLALHEMNINGTPRFVSVLSESRGHTAGWGNRISSFSWSMGLNYTIIDTFHASETLALFALEALSVEGFDVETYQRTPMRVNAHDTAAIKALFLEDNLVGPTLVIYVLQTIEDTDQALVLDIVVMLDRITEQNRTILDRLGFHIGIDFLEYLAIATEMAAELGE